MGSQPQVGPEQVIAAQAATLNDLANRRHILADALAKSVLEALEVWAAMAETPGHPAQLTARDLLGRWHKVMERAHGQAVGLAVVSQLPGVGNGRS